MPTNAELAATILSNALARLAELDAVPVATRAVMSYSDGTRQYGWNEYRAAQQAIVEAYGGKDKALLQTLGGPFEVVSVARG